jgi:hypothetical protein
MKQWIFFSMHQNLPVLQQGYEFFCLCCLVIQKSSVVPKSSLLNASALNDAERLVCLTGLN